MSFNGKVTNRLTGEPIVGVAVTDGRNIALTHEQGNYALPGWERSNTLGVCMLTLAHDDWFCYTGNVPGTYDFAITPAPDRKALTVLQKAITLPSVPLVTPVVEEDVMYTVDFDGNICKCKI